MWWDALPSSIITSGCLFFPTLFIGVTSYWYHGNVHGRQREFKLDHYLIFRDKAVTGGKDPFRQHKQLGLDGIPDS